MPIELPKEIADYFEADQGKGTEATIHCFAENAIVRDEGHTYSGLDAIRQWKTDASGKYTYAVEPIAITIDHDRTVVTCHLAGNFPGSPLDLRYFFIIDGGKITDLEIVP